MSQIEYRTETAAGTTELDGQVNAALEKGFELFGTPYLLGNLVCQAMTRATEKRRDQMHNPNSRGRRAE
jgi:hypothetical protein